MRWTTINQMLGLAVSDPDFCCLLLASPLDAAQQEGFNLTPAEEEILRTIVAHNLQEFSQQLLEHLDSSP